MSRAAAERLEPFHQSSRSFRIAGWALAPFIAVHIVLASISGYRAIVQIYRVELSVADTVLRPGSSITFSYVSSGRVPTDAEVELIQGTIKRSIATAALPANENPSYDPRSRSATKTVTVAEQSLSAFAPGPARLRITAYGNMQWLRTPPPVVKEIPVAIGAPP